MTTTGVAAPASPYKGLAAFADSDLDALLFFGREREIEVIAANLVAASLTVLYGPSGVGKTSLLRAGVAQRLRRDGAAVTIFSAWSGDPVKGLLSAVEAEVRRVVSRVESPPSGAAADVLAGWTRRLGGDLYLILDQFEEYFLYHGDGGPFLEVAEAIRRADVHVNVLLGVREDALAQLDAFKTALPTLYANSLRLDRLDRQAARRAILGPLERYNELGSTGTAVEVEAELVEELLDSVEAGRIQLGDAGRGGTDEAEGGEGRIEAPYLQLVLERLWEVETGRGSTTLRLESLRELGGAARIVEDHLERAMAALSPEEKDAAAAMYNHLVTPSGTKIAHRAGDLARYAAVDEREAQRVLERLTNERIVRAGENGAAGMQYEIFHDVLADAVLAWRTRHEADRRLEDERQAASRRHRRLVVVAAASLVALAAMAAVTVYALAQRSQSRENAREARAGELVALAAASLGTDPEESVRLALRASRIIRSQAVEDILRKGLRELRAEAVIPLGAGTATSLSADGTMVASARGNAVRLYALPGGGIVRTLRHPKAAGASFSPVGRLMATVGGDGRARIWDEDSLVRVVAHSARFTLPAFSADGRRVATVTGDRVVHVSGLRGDRGRLSFTQGSDVMAARFSLDGRLIVTGGSDDLVRIWDARTGALRRTLTGHLGRVGDVAFSPDGTLLATGSTDLTARVWDVTEDFELVTITPGHEGYVSRVEFSPSGEELATGSQDRRARIFDADSPTIRAVLPGHGDAISDLAYSPDGAKLSTLGVDGMVRLWDARPFPRLERVRKHPKPVTRVDFSPDGQRIISATTGAEDVRLAGSARVRAAIGEHTALAVSPDGRLAVSGHEDGSARIWDVESARPMRELAPHVGPVTSTTFSPEGRYVVTTGADHRTRLSHVESGSQRWVASQSASVRDADFSADGRWVVTVGPRYAALVDADSGERLLLLDGRDRVVRAAAFSPSGWRIATGGESGAVRAYDCRLCGELDDLIALAESRLARLRPRTS